MGILPCRQKSQPSRTARTRAGCSSCRWWIQQALARHALRPNGAEQDGGLPEERPPYRQNRQCAHHRQHQHNPAWGVALFAIGLSPSAQRSARWRWSRPPHNLQPVAPAVSVAAPPFGYMPVHGPAGHIRVPCSPLHH